MNDSMEQEDSEKRGRTGSLKYSEAICSPKGFLGEGRYGKTDADGHETKWQGRFMDILWHRKLNGMKIVDGVL